MLLPHTSAGSGPRLPSAHPRTTSKPTAGSAGKKVLTFSIPQEKRVSPVQPAPQQRRREVFENTPNSPASPWLLSHRADLKPVSRREEINKQNKIHPCAGSCNFNQTNVCKKGGRGAGAGRDYGATRSKRSRLFHICDPS